MALGIISDPNGLSQGDETVVSDIVFGSPTVNSVDITSAGSNLPTLVVDEFFEVRDHSDTVNNGLYQVTAVNTVNDDYTCDKVSGANPIAAGSESASTFSSTTIGTATLTDLVFANQSGRTVDMTSAGSNLPTLVVGSRFEVADHSDADNNGIYEVTVVNTVNDDYTCIKLDDSTNDPNDAVSEAATTISEKKNLFWDTAGLGIYLLESGGLDLDGVLGQAFYSKAVIDWKDDNFLIANAPFPMLTIDADAGKYLIGQDPSGNNSGWAPKDDADIALGTFSIRTRKMFRNMGWSEIASDGNLNAQYSGVRTLGAFLDETAGTGDLAYYQFGTDTTVDDTVDFTFNGPVNEAIEVYDGLATPADTGTGFAITTNDTITRNDGGNWRDDGYVVGGQIEIIGAEDPANDGTWTIASVEDLADGDLVVEGTGLTNNAADTTASFAVDNRRALTLRLRERTTPGNSNARTFAQSDLAAAGETVLSNRLFTFGLSNAQDLDITSSDGTITGSSPWNGMTITYYSTPQSQGDGGGGGDGQLVGGPYNFGIIIDGNNGTNTQVYEFVQYSLRQATDIDADADTAIGKTMDGLMRFVGPTLEVGSTDGGLTYPRNPDGGGSGVYIINLNSASANDTVYFDNLGTQRNAPLTVSVTLDFNQTLIDDTVAEYTLYFDYTIRTEDTTLTDLIITAGTGANGTFDSAGANLPGSLDAGVGAYVRVSGMAGADEAMNGIYQVTAITSTSQYDVTRYDAATIVTTSSTACNLDQHTYDAPDFIIVQDNLAAPVTGLASADFSFSFDYSNNTQGGRTGGTDASVVARAIGQSTAQYTQSTVQTIGQSALTIPLTSQIERNFNNP